MIRLLSGILVILLAAVTFSACGGSSSSSYSSAPAASSASPPAYYEQSSPDFTYEAAQTESAIPLPLLTPSSDEGKKLVYTVSLWLQTTTFNEGTRKLLNVVEEMGGHVQNAYVEGRSLYEPDMDRAARYTLRIPSENLASFLTTMEDNFNLWRLEQDSQEITAQYQQTDSRLEDLKKQEERLLAALQATQDSEEKVILERELSDVQYEIGNLNASKGSMDNAVLYSTVTVHLFEVNPDNINGAPKDPFNEKLGKTTSGSLNGFVAFWQGVLLFLIAALPVIIVLAVFAVIVIFALRFWRKKGSKIKEAFTGKPKNTDTARTPKKSAPDRFFDDNE